MDDTRDEVGEILAGMTGGRTGGWAKRYPHLDRT